MAQRSRRTPIALAILLGAVFTAIFAVAETQDTPYRAAIAFSQAYFQLDPNMASLLCKASLGDEESSVERYLYAMEQEARNRGYALSALKSRLADIETHTIQQSAQQAQVRLMAERRNASNPIFAWVATVFNLGKTQPVVETLQLVQEDGRWKVCGAPFALAKN